MMDMFIASLYYGATCFLSGMLFMLALSAPWASPDHTSCHAPDFERYRENLKTRRRGHGF